MLMTIQQIYKKWKVAGILRCPFMSECMNIVTLHQDSRLYIGLCSPVPYKEYVDTFLLSNLCFCIEKQKGVE